MHCPTCSLVLRQAFWVNSPPFKDAVKDTDNQGTAHMLGKPHKNRLARMGVLDEAKLRVFGEMIGFEFDYAKEPYEALKTYIQERGEEFTQDPESLRGT